MITIVKTFRSVMESFGFVYDKALNAANPNHKSQDIYRNPFNGKGLTFFKDNPTYAGVTEAIDKPIYDMATVTTATTSLDLFQVPQSSSKSALSTSMRQAGQLPSPEKFTVKRIGNIINTAVVADLYLLLFGIVYNFKVNDKEYTKGPLYMYPLGVGPFGQTTANATGVLSNGFPGELGVRNLMEEIPINPLDPFIGNFTMYSTTAIAAISTLSASTNIWNVLQGPYERAI